MRGAVAVYHPIRRLEKKTGNTNRQTNTLFLTCRSSANRKSVKLNFKILLFYVNSRFNMIPRDHGNISKIV